MVTDALLTVVGGFASFVVGLFPDGDAPAFLTSTLPGLIDTAASYVVGVSAWVPFDHLGVVLAWVALVLAAAVGVRLVRIVASFLTAGGGSAA